MKKRKRRGYQFTATIMTIKVQSQNNYKEIKKYHKNANQQHHETVNNIQSNLKILIEDIDKRPIGEIIDNLK